MTKHPGAAIRARREARGLSLRRVAGELGVSPATLSGIERGTTTLSVTRLGQLAELLGTTAATLLSGEAQTSPADTAAASASPRASRSTTNSPGGRDWRTFDDIAMDPILEAALRLFVRQGFHATSTREVAGEAGLSVAGVYHHYPSKEGLLVAILEVTMRELAWRTEAARVEGGDPVEAFALMVESLALFHAVRGDLAFIGASEMRAFGPEERSRMTALRDGVQHALDRQAQACVAAGEFHVDDLRTACRAIATMCTALPSWFRHDGPLAAEEVAAQYARYALAVMGHAVSGGRRAAAESYAASVAPSGGDR